MTRSRPLAVTALAALLLAGCGSSGDALAGKTPKAMLELAAQRQTSSSLRFTLAIRVNVDASQVRNLSADDLRSFGLPVGGLTVKGRGAQESAQRRQVDLDLAGDRPGQLREVTYDSASYVSRDGGKTYTTASADSVTGGLNLSPSQLSDVARNVTNVTDLGRRTVDGQDCEHLQAPVTQAQLAALLAGPGTSSGGGVAGGQGADLLKQLVQIRHGVLDVDVRRSDGALVRSAADVAIVLDLDRLSGLFGAAGAGSPTGVPGGSVALGLSLDSHFSDYGASISVSRPKTTAGDATATPEGTPPPPSPPDSSSPGAAEGGSSSPSPAGTP